jgi:mediator of RNA polymerase II transcription subunit 17
MLAGPMAFDRYELMEMTKTQTLLEQIIAQAQHIFMRKRTQYVLDTLARDVKDPQITSHWNAVNSPIMSCVKINITTHGYDAACRTSLVIHVKEMSLKCLLHIVQKKTFFRTIDSEKILGKSWWTI